MLFASNNDEKSCDEKELVWQEANRGWVSRRSPAVRPATGAEAGTEKEAEKEITTNMLRAKRLA